MRARVASPLPGARRAGSAASRACRSREDQRVGVPLGNLTWGEQVRSLPQPATRSHASMKPAVRRAGGPKRKHASKISTVPRDDHAPRATIPRYRDRNPAASGPEAPASIASLGPSCGCASMTSMTSGQRALHWRDRRNRTWTRSGIAWSQERAGGGTEARREGRRNGAKRRNAQSAEPRAPGLVRCHALVLVL